MEANFENAVAFLQSIGKPHDRGFVWFHEGSANGWSADPLPKDYEPNVIFVNLVDGSRWLTVGGNARDGAERMERLPEPDTWEARGMAWWNSLPRSERDKLMKRAEEMLGRVPSVADVALLFGPGSTATGKN